MVKVDQAGPTHQPKCLPLDVLGKRFNWTRVNTRAAPYRTEDSTRMFMGMRFTNREDLPGRGEPSPTLSSTPSFILKPRRLVLRLVLRVRTDHLSLRVGAFPSDIRSAGEVAGETPGLVHQLEPQSWTNIPCGSWQACALQEYSWSRSFFPSKPCRPGSHATASSCSCRAPALRGRIPQV